MLYKNYSGVRTQLIQTHIMSKFSNIPISPNLEAMEIKFHRNLPTFIANKLPVQNVHQIITRFETQNISHYDAVLMCLL
jgi:hypothetical protein